MSKSLETEYKNAVLNDLPDLWDRIEAALPDEKEKSDAPIIDFQKEKNVEISDNKSRKKRRIPVWVKVAVPFAALGVITIIPISAVVIGFGVSSLSKSDSNMYFAAGNATSTEATSAETMINYEAEDEAYAESEKSCDVEDLNDDWVTFCKPEDKTVDTMVSESDVVLKKVNVVFLNFSKNDAGEIVVKMKFLEDIDSLDGTLSFKKDDEFEAVIDNDVQYEENAEYNVSIKSEEGSYIVVVNED